MPIRSNLVYLSFAVLGTALLLLSCASSTHPDHLTIRDPKHFTGTLHVDTCVSGAPSDDISLDEHGLGKTSLCPARDRTVELEIIETDHHYKIASNKVNVRRTGDGIATSIEANLPVS
jgi:hypothetical protein